MTEAFPLSICIEATKFVLLSLSFFFFFSYREDLHDNLAKPGRGGGDAPKNGVFAPFWSENGYRLCPFGLESGMIFEETTRVYERICRFK